MDFEPLKFKLYINKESCVGSTNTKQKGGKKHQDLNVDSESTSSSIKFYHIFVEEERIKSRTCWFVLALAVVFALLSSCVWSFPVIPWLCSSWFFPRASKFPPCLCGSFVPFVLFMLLAPIVRMFSISLGAWSFNQGWFPVRLLPVLMLDDSSKSGNSSYCSTSTK